MNDTVKNDIIKTDTDKIHETTKKSTDSDLQKIFKQSNYPLHTDNDFLNDFINSAADTGQNINKIMSLSQKLTSELFFSGFGGSDKTVFDPLNAMQSWFDTLSGMMNNPEKIIESQMNLWEQYTKLCAYSLAKMGGDTVSPLIKPEYNDRRFRSEAWNDTFFDFIKQCYLLVGNSVLETVEKTGTDMDERSRQRALFFTKQYIDALSPSNFLMTNPDALQETFKTGGANLIKGLENLVRDFEQGQGRLNITQTDKTAFTIGKNLATSAGQVVFRNDLIELIHYNPQSDMVYAQPLLILPPFINKFYILDMRPENSLINWITKQGFNTFVISWRNVNEQQSHYNFESYMRLGLLSALDEIEKITGQKQSSVVGYCISGTMVSMALSWLKAQGRNPIQNVTYFASQVDFSQAGELSYFVDKDQIQNIEKMMRISGGYLQGQQMADTFNLLRANDLIWSFVVNNYLLGKDPFPFDLLYWNSDTTRMPMALQLEYLEHCYLNNDLSQNRMTIAEHIIDLSTIDIPMYIQASKEDHIAPALSVYNGAKFYTGKIRFVLAGSGHIAGVINHPDNHKYNHWINEKSDGNLPDTLDNWLSDATEHQGSWWNDWAKWLSAQNSQKIPAVMPKNALCPAPGEYVLEG